MTDTTLTCAHCGTSYDGMREGKIRMGQSYCSILCADRAHPNFRNPLDTDAYFETKHCPICDFPNDPEAGACWSCDHEFMTPTPRTKHFPIELTPISNEYAGYVRYGERFRSKPND